MRRCRFDDVSHVTRSRIRQNSGGSEPRILANSATSKNPRTFAHPAGRLLHPPRSRGKLAAVKPLKRSPQMLARSQAPYFSRRSLLRGAAGLLAMPSLSLLADDRAPVANPRATDGDDRH